jgi:bifunctional DNA-binding transcriptional regulator/antitoxin component of YhaV-PrlF toxin-antitoxin module
MIMHKVYETTVEYNDDFQEYFVTLPEDLLESVGWEEGDVLEWSVNKDGTILVERVDEEFANDREED